MKNNSSGWLTILLTAAVGLLLIIFHNQVNLLQWIILAVGIAIAVPSLYNLLASFRNSHRASDGNVRISSIIASVGALALGIWIIVNPTFFVGLLAYLFAALMILYGITQLIILNYASRPARLSFGFYIIPLLEIIAGVVILCTSVHTMNALVVLITGIMLVLSAINWALPCVTCRPAPVQKPKEIEQ